MAGPRRQMGDILVTAGMLTPQQLKSALEVQRSSGLRLGEVLIGLGYAGEADIARAIADQLQIPFIPDHELQVDFQVARLIPAQLARRKLVLPVAERNGRILLAMVDPLDVFTLDEIRFLINRPVEPCVVTRQSLERLLSQYERVSALRRREAPPEPEGPVAEQPAPEADAAPVVALVNEQIDRALAEQASDIHIEPGETKFRVRFRVDGFLREVIAPAMSYHPAVVARIKVMAGLDIAERRLPQDGRIELRSKGRNVDLRVSTLPTIHGEKVVLRIFDKSRKIPALGELGFSPTDYERYLDIISRPHGMVLVTGPTGSGKTTTLISTIAHLAAPDKNIVTVEDPVEYRLPGVNHVQINPRTGLTFAEGLRAILRQDPNIIMVGEVRDTETADTAVRAALTGHMVLSTLHTNDAPGALTRLVDMGVEPYLIASSVHGVLAQRLVRRLCPHCRSPRELDPHLFQAHGVEVSPEAATYQPVGCNKCRGMGYAGRFPIFELLRMDPELREMVSRRRPSAELRAAGERAGMQPLLVSGLYRVLTGDTTLEEVLRVAQGVE